MVGGQARDIAGETTTLNEIDIATMQAMKTGALIRAAVRMGAILGGASRDALGHLTAYAEASGRAFQIADDLLDVTASAQSMGKATGKDAGRNKQTLVGAIGVEAARRHLGDVVHDAITALTPFGPEADTLRDAARYFATRGN
jgi:farnesyl diphosphate synthase